MIGTDRRDSGIYVLSVLLDDNGDNIYIYIYIYIYIICRWIICWWIFLTNCWIARKRLVYKCLVWFYGISIIVGYLMPNALYIYIYTYMTRFSLVSWHINYCGLFDAKCTIYIYIHDLVWFGFMAYQLLWVIWCQMHYIYIHTWLGFDWFHGISIIVVYLMPNALYIYIHD